MNESTKTSLKETVAQRLVERIEKSLPDLTEGLNRFEIELEGISAIDWLSRQSCPHKIYFSDRDKSFVVAAIGQAKTVTEQNSKNLKDALDAIDNTLKSSDPAIKFFGGICFDYDDEPADDWEAFGRYRFTVPQFEIRIEDKKTVFACNVEHPGKGDIAGMLKSLRESIASVNFEIANSESVDKYTITNHADLPEEKLWSENVTRVIDDLGDKHIQKVVLARKSVLQTSVPAGAVEILSRLKKNNVMTYDFCFQFAKEDAFIGCSPECLFSAGGRKIYSEAIAGTRLKGTGTAEQKKYHAELVESEKEQLEHDYVFDDVSESLAEICDSVEVANRRQVVSLSYLQHFRSGFNGQLKDGISVCDIIRSLHPTAAVNGYPSEAAMRQIRKYEPFSRGWFAGPVGWIGKDSANFAVAIRSALIRGKQISLFAGAGIVKSSQPTLEWQETENKIKQFLDVI
ncbi:MAG: isochorismate synthase [Planctomycetes bacterium]|nr:isochorismate synthase [Planctomycetota bacterium]